MDIEMKDPQTRQSGSRRVRDRRIERVVELVPPVQILDQLPLSSEQEDAVLRHRAEIASILNREDDRLLVIVGPCSVHDPEAALDYAERLSARAEELRDDLVVAMRVYFEKPRTTVGWKGLINDPHLDGSGDVNTGLLVARGLLREVLDLGLPAGCEFLDPITPLIHLRPRRLGRDRRPNRGEPDPPAARLRSLDAGRLQERHRRQRQGRG